MAKREMELSGASILFCFNPHQRIFFFREIGGREIEGEKETSMWERDIKSAASCVRLNRGSNSQPRFVPWPGIEPITFWCTGWCSNQLSLLARAIVLFCRVTSVILVQQLYPSKVAYLQEGLWFCCYCYWFCVCVCVCVCEALKDKRKLKGNHQKIL